MLKKNGNINFFITKVLVPIVILVLYCISFKYFSSRLLPAGVNYIFVSSLMKYVLLLLVGVFLIIVVIFILKSGDRLALKYSFEKLFASDFLLLLLPLTPVVQYILNNQDILSPIFSLYILVFFMVFSSLYIFVVPVLLRATGSARKLMILGMAFVFTITYMAFLSHYFSWFGEGNLKIQLIFFVGSFLVVLFLYNLKNKRILYLIFVIFFVSNSLSQALSQGVRPDESSLPIVENRLLSFVDGRIPAITPNIYLLVYDAYVANETMLANGIDNSHQEDYLKGQGFVLYPHTYSVGSNTIESMSKVLNASIEYYGHSRRGVSGNGIVQNILKYLGYETFGLFPSDFMFRGIGSSYDFSIPESIKPVYIQLISAILIGEFRTDIGYNAQTYDQFEEIKQRIFKGVSGNQVFIYMHSDIPGHSQDPGVCGSEETNLYNVRLRDANNEMTQDINTIIANDPEAIVIVAGDHGPYLTKNCDIMTGTTGVFDISEISRLDIQDRFGSFLAIRWPTEDYVKYDDITVLQDIFPAIFAYLYKDVRILDSKIEPVIPIPNKLSDVSVNNGIIIGGINNGEPLFLSGK